MELAQYEITIPLIPVTKKNSQRIITIGGRPRIIPSAKYVAYEKDAKKYVPHFGIAHPCNVEAVFYMPTRRRVDLVNLQEALLDVLVKHGCLHDDNCAIVVSMDGSVVRYDHDYPRTEVKITEVRKGGLL